MPQLKPTPTRCGEEVFEADAVVSAVGINGAKAIVRASPTLNRRKMFQDLMNLRCVIRHIHRTIRTQACA